MRSMPSLLGLCRRRHAFAILAIGLGTTLAGPAFAQQAPRAEDVAAARALAVEGIKLADAGDCRAAVEKLERAEALRHAPTILGRLGECQVALGKIVLGTENLQRVVREQLAADAPAAFRDAQARAQKVLDTALPRIGKTEDRGRAARRSGFGQGERRAGAPGGARRRAPDRPRQPPGRSVSSRLFAGQRGGQARRRRERECHLAAAAGPERRRGRSTGGRRPPPMGPRPGPTAVRRPSRDPRRRPLTRVQPPAAVAAGARRSRSSRSASVAWASSSER